MSVSVCKLSPENSLPGPFAVTAKHLHWTRYTPAHLFLKPEYRTPSRRNKGLLGMCEGESNE